MSIVRAVQRALARLAFPSGTDAEKLNIFR
jgi:hypothetical protein